MDLQWDQMDLTKGTILIKHLKNRDQSVQALSGEEVEALKKLPKRSSFVFLGVKGSLFVDTFQLVVKKLDRTPNLDFWSIPICCGTPAILSWQTKMRLPTSQMSEGRIKAGRAD